jgi:peroxiredoxin Q/BCP
MKIRVGQTAPGFKLLDQDGVTHTLSEYKGTWVLLYFYPKDDTPGCTKEACAIRDDFTDFEKLKLQVLGVSADSVKNQLPFTLLADEEKELIKAYGVWGKKKFMGREYNGIFRQSFLIDPKGKIAKVYEKVKPLEHAREVLADLKLEGVQ